MKAEEDSCRAEQARELQARIAHERKIRKRRDKQIARVKLKLAMDIAARSPDLVARSRVKDLKIPGSLLERELRAKHSHLLFRTPTEQLHDALRAVNRYIDEFVGSGACADPAGADTDTIAPLIEAWKEAGRIFEEHEYGAAEYAGGRAGLVMDMDYGAWYEEGRKSVGIGMDSNDNNRRTRSSSNSKSGSLHRRHRLDFSPIRSISSCSTPRPAKANRGATENGTQVIEPPHCTLGVALQRTGRKINGFFEEHGAE